MPSYGYGHARYMNKIKELKLRRERHLNYYNELHLTIMRNKEASNKIKTLTLILHDEATSVTTLQKRSLKKTTNLFHYNKSKILFLKKKLDRISKNI